MAFCGHYARRIYLLVLLCLELEDSDLTLQFAIPHVDLVGVSSRSQLDTENLYLWFQSYYKDA